MGYDQKQLKEPIKPLYDFSGKRIEPVGVRILPFSFSMLQNPHTECVTFDVIDMLYPHNAIFGRGLLNTFEATLHSGYLYLKIPATLEVILIFGSQKDARNIKQDFTLSQKNVHFLWEEWEQYQQSSCPFKEEAPTEYKKAIDADGEFKKVPLDPIVPDRAVCLGTETYLEEQAELLAFLEENTDVFAWSTTDLVGVIRDIIEHRLQLDPSAKPRKQKLQKIV
jgi:hypothetical protein